MIKIKSHEQTILTQNHEKRKKRKNKEIISKYLIKAIKNSQNYIL